MKPRQSNKATKNQVREGSQNNVIAVKLFARGLAQGLAQGLASGPPISRRLGRLDSGANSKQPGRKSGGRGDIGRTSGCQLRRTSGVEGLDQGLARGLANVASKSSRPGRRDSRATSGGQAGRTSGGRGEIARTNGSQPGCPARRTQFKDD